MRCRMGYNVLSAEVARASAKAQVLHRGLLHLQKPSSVENAADGGAEESATDALSSPGREGEGTGVLEIHSLLAESAPAEEERIEDPSVRVRRMMRVGREEEMAVGRLKGDTIADLGWLLRCDESDVIVLGVEVSGKGIERVG